MSSGSDLEVSDVGSAEVLRGTSGGVMSIIIENQLQRINELEKLHERLEKERKLLEAQVETAAGGRAPGRLPVVASPEAPQEKNSMMESAGAEIQPQGVMRASAPAAAQPSAPCVAQLPSATSMLSTAPPTAPAAGQSSTSAPRAGPPMATVVKQPTAAAATAVTTTAATVTATATPTAPTTTASAMKTQPAAVPRQTAVPTKDGSPLAPRDNAGEAVSGGRVEEKAAKPPDTGSHNLTTHGFRQPGTKSTSPADGR
mmetsp:Transcript_11666/g.35590  ORF Transcript_11666/g.35590 Transcript_11666/m.35590 type:complete len:257 (+) Transcript_11666:231-1001(+)|eukprot:CAMPEP_0198729756 /NCGR_PEP_ID=MMETSP1475-20131203/20866_1 /TAXON_ID= ORGANISM="Unidentified sp., Strain CCMP1999" /NCGR_SAMPLE_ID=MMETSP1475 /ASSEMBLY_ACC=CAM_ASM_001111 /LENGTH=256 /DNA_ID=CAMNT_0044492459 /DNA_START=190 /DNA_END=960 /DNA_ORIENTATION=-